MEVTLGHEPAVVVLGPPAFPDENSMPEDGVWFMVELRAPGLHVQHTVVLWGDLGLAPYFGELAASWRGWTGDKVWRSDEDDLVISATSSDRGRNTLTFTVRQTSRPTDNSRPTWHATLEVEMEAGAETAGVARALNQSWNRHAG